MRCEERWGRSTVVTFTTWFRGNHEERIRHAQAFVYAHRVFEILDSLYEVDVLKRDEEREKERRMRI